MSTVNLKAQLAAILAYDGDDGDLPQRLAVHGTFEVHIPDDVREHHSDIHKRVCGFDARMQRHRDRFFAGIQNRRPALFLVSSERKRQMLSREGLYAAVVRDGGDDVGSGSESRGGQICQSFSASCLLLDEFNVFSWSIYNTTAQLADYPPPCYAIGKTTVEVG